MWTTSSEHCRFVVWLHKLWTTETGQPANRPTWQSLAAVRPGRYGARRTRHANAIRTMRLSTRLTSLDRRRDYPPVQLTHIG